MKVEKVAKTVERDVLAGIKKLLAKTPLTEAELADALDCSPRRIRSAIRSMKASGAMLLERPGGKFDIGSSAALPAGEFTVVGKKGEWTHHFGVTTDNHLCNQ